MRNFQDMDPRPRLDDEGTSGGGEAPPIQSGPPATIPYQRFSEVAGENKSLKARVAELEAGSATTERYAKLDEHFREHPDQLAGIGDFMQGKAKIVPILDDEDPNVNAIGRVAKHTDEEIQKIQRELAIDKQERIVEKHRMELKEELGELQSTYPFLKNEGHRQFVMRAYKSALDVDPDASLETTVAEYAELNKGTIKPTPASQDKYRESKLVPAYGPGGRSASPPPKKQDGKIGEIDTEEMAQKLEDFLNKPG